MVSSTDGSPTSTGWNRRSSAGSFSTCSRNSSSVVAPTIRSSPRASIGLSMLHGVHRALAGRAGADDRVHLVDERDDLPVAALDLVEHGLAAAPRTRRGTSRRPPSRRGRARSASCRAASPGTSPATMRWARPSTTAVLPTPGSPMSTGLFLVRRDSTCTTRRISASRPITGSSLPSRARAVRSTPYFSSAWKVASGSAEVTCGPAADLVDRLGQRVARSRRAARAGPRRAPPAVASPSSRCSVET